MMEYIKITISLCTLLIVVGGFLLTIDQVRSTNEIRLESNRTNIIASSGSEVLDNIVSSSQPLGAGEGTFLRALFSHYMNIYRIDQHSLLFYGALSDSYVADASGRFCWWLSHDVAKKFWRDVLIAADVKRNISKLPSNTDFSEIEGKWCNGAAQ